MTQQLATVLLVAVVALYAAAIGAAVTLVVRAFQLSFGWGLALLFVPFAPLLFLYSHWDIARGPALLGFAAAAGMFGLGAFDVVAG